jgi:hypothetical protein
MTGHRFAHCSVVPVDVELVQKRLASDGVDVGA